ncbi:uncharacterized protein LOC105778188 isoform X2 [Gossypium raimondii]|uniref:uncharacterized protein LOC105778188 isoform X2 n=1 Tax=Gossypium raimondii TaxID=29730 RepID=UPI00227A198F|nr:uncharacterized protein LOC105778188 isoform X2 [Gossypium raimondii]
MDLQSILVKLLSHFKDLEHVFSLNHFLQILDMMHGNSRGIVNMHILDMATRNGYVHDPTTIQLLFEISQALHSDTDLVNMKNDDNQQQARFISRFVRMVDHGVEYERHLAFLMECRGGLSNIIELKFSGQELACCSCLIVYCYLIHMKMVLNNNVDRIGFSMNYSCGTHELT